MIVACLYCQNDTGPRCYPRGDNTEMCTEAVQDPQGRTVNEDRVRNIVYSTTVADQ